MSVRYRSSPYYTSVKFVNLEELPKALKIIKSRKVFVVDKNVYRLYRDLIDKLVSKDPIHIIEATELNKNYTNFTNLLELFTNLNIGRNDCIIAIGGGVISDLTGYAAAVFKRGCRLIFIPTTFVGMIDAAVGGKNGINYSVTLTADNKSDLNKTPSTEIHPSELVHTLCLGTLNQQIHYKNILGTFYPANYLFICMEFLDTLSPDDILNGWAECIKVSLLVPNKLYAAILKSNKNITKSIIRDAITLKEKLCRNDLYDKGMRRKLNLGHTFAHTLEAVSGYRISHGVAVSLGIRGAAKLSLEKQKIDETVYRKIIKPLDMFDFPYSIADELKPHIEEKGRQTLLMDKKRDKDLKIVLFAGFQNTRVVSCSNPQEIIDILLALPLNES